MKTESSARSDGACRSWYRMYFPHSLLLEVGEEEESERPGLSTGPSDAPQSSLIKEGEVLPVPGARQPLPLGQTFCHD